MDFFEMKKKKPSELFTRAAFLAILFIIVSILFLMSSKNEKPGDLRSNLLNGMANYASFNEKQKDELKARNAGFWQYASDTNSMNEMIYMNDKFELKTNGIFWQVTEYTIGLPSKKSTRFVHIATGYMNPFSKTGKTLDSIVCDVHLIRQAYIIGKDTCYGPSNTDTTWSLVADGKRLVLDNKVYSPYDTSGPALFAFFPKGVLEIVDKITIYQCPKASSLIDFTKRMVASDMSTVEVATLNADAAQKIIDAYYRIFLEEAVKNLQRSQKSGSGRGKIQVAFDVTWEGKVTSAKIISLSADYKKLSASVLSDVNAWTFPRLKSSAPPLHIEREFWF